MKYHGKTMEFVGKIMGGPWNPYEKLWEDHSLEDYMRIAAVSDCKTMGGPHHSQVMNDM